MKRFAIRTAAALVGASIFAWAPLAGARTVYSDDGISELTAPDHWSVRADIGRSASLRVSDSSADYHLTVYTYLPEEYEPTTLEQFAENFSADLIKNLDDGRMSEPRKLTINGRPAVQYEISGRIGEDRFVYLSTTVEGKRAKHQLVATVSEADYPSHQGALNQAILSFRESPRKRPAKERIDLVFDWSEPGESRFTVRNTSTGRKGTHEMQMSGTTTVRPLKDEGLLVSTRVSDFKASSSDPDEEKNPAMQDLLQQVTSEIPDYVVSNDGEFIRVESLSAFYKRLEQAVLKALPDDRDTQKKARKLLKSVLPEEAVLASVQDGWNKEVQNWAGGSYAVGESYTYETQYQMPALGEAMFPMSVSQKLAGRVPCHEQDKARSCVKLVQTSKVAGAAFDQAMRAYVNQLMKDAAGDKAPEIGVDGVEIVTTVTLVADPQTMLPYESKESEVKTTRISVNGQKQAAKEVSETVTRYTY